MTTTTEQPVELQPASVAAPRPELDWERDWQGRPRILPDPDWDPKWVERWAAGRGDADGAVPYTRVTTFAEALQDASALTRWKMRRAVFGAARRPDYVTALLALTLEDRDRDALNDLAEKCLEAAGPNAADVGTALHSFTERLDRGEDVGQVPPEYVGSVDAYRRAVAHLRFVEWECRTVCDELETAGTPDRYGFCDVPDPDGVVDELRVIDTKTGRVDYSAGKFATQLAIYAHSRLYHPGTGKRTRLEELHGAKVNTRWGLIVHTPAGANTAELLWLNLEHGWAGAQQCKQTREWRAGATAGLLLRPVFARPPRPATTDGTCRGRKQDAQPCGYKAKTKQEDPLAAQFCGRHQDQARDLARWLEENPDMDPTAGEEQAAPRDPVHLVQQRTVEEALAAAAADVTVAAAGDAVDRAETAVERASTIGQGFSPGFVYSRPPVHDGESQDAADLDGTDAPDDAGPDRGEAADLAAASGDPAPAVFARVAATAQSLPDPDRPARELQVGTYALDPATEVNGNPRPLASLQTPEDAQAALLAAENAVAHQIEAAQTETDLLVIYQQNAAVWNSRLTAAAGQRSQQLAERERTARPSAALVAALSTAPDPGTLSRLFLEYGRTELWTPEAAAVADTRWKQLAAAAQL